MKQTVNISIKDECDNEATIEMVFDDESKEVRATVAFNPPAERDDDNILVPGIASTFLEMFKE